MDRPDEVFDPSSDAALDADREARKKEGLAKLDALLEEAKEYPGTELSDAQKNAIKKWLAAPRVVKIK